MRFGVLGPLEVLTDDRRPVKVPEAKVRALLAILLANRGQPVSVDRLVEDLWGDRPPANAGGALQTKVSQLRRALELGEPGGRELVAFRPAGYALRIGAEAVDADRFVALTARARTAEDPRAKAALLADALALWRGPVFAEFGDAEFSRALIHRLSEERLAALEEQAEARLALGEHSAVAAELGELVASHPLRERLRAAQLLALYRAGRQSEALAEYQVLRARLAEELGVDPGPELVALHQSMLEQRPELNPGERPREAAPGTNLPARFSELIGREQAVTEVAAQLAAHRLVTLTGPGGVGKTRLALETAGVVADRFPDGVWLVELAGSHPATGCTLADMIAAVLGVRTDAVAADEVDTQLVNALRSRELLLVLDNCEHLVELVAEVTPWLLGASPGLRVLATSQEALGLRGEVLHSVAPLDLPGSELSSIEESSAVRLFTARAAAASPGFALSSENAAAVAEICRRLDGIPLALELAASRIRALGPAELLDRLDDRFRLLVAGRRDAPARQQTLRAMIDWSWELLTAAERIVLRRLAVHAEGGDLEAAEAVCAGSGVKPAEVLDLLARLVDRSLVTVAQVGGRPRYRLLESVSAYCFERLAEAGELDEVRRRHHRHYLDLALRADARLCGPEQRRWLDRLDVESPNLRAALAGAIGDGDRDLALRLVGAMAWFWFLRGRLSEGHRSVHAALAVPGESLTIPWATALTWRTGFTLLLGEENRAELVNEVQRAYQQVDDPLGRARAEWFLSYALMGAGDLDQSLIRVESALKTFRELDDRWGEAAALSTLASHTPARGDLDKARRDSERSLELFRELGDRWGEVQATNTLSSLAEINGDYDLAERLHTNTLRLAEELGLWTEVSGSLSGLGRISLLRKDFLAAEQYHERARLLSKRQSHKRGEQFAELGLGLGARRQGKLDAAEKHLTNWLDWCRKIDGDIGVALILAELGFVSEQRGDARAALLRHRDGLVAARNAGDPRAIALAFEGVAGAYSIGGRCLDGARLLGAASAIRDSLGTPLPEAERVDVDRISGVLVASLGVDRFAVEFESGRGLSQVDVVAMV